METLQLLRILLLEMVSFTRVSRVPEPDLIMEDSESVQEFADYGNFKTPLGMSYLFYAAHICAVIRSKDFVVDLGCGPGNLLLLVAQLNPEAQFVGLDLSEGMLSYARQEARQLGVNNVRFIRADMTNLEAFTNTSVDVCLSTLAMHHLPSVDHLRSMLREIARVLKPGGGLFLTDYGRLKRERSMHFMAHQYQERQPPRITQDYLNSLKASFSIEEIRACYQMILRPYGQLCVTPLLPMVISIISPGRRSAEDRAYQDTLRSMVSSLDPELKRDFYLLLKLSRWGYWPHPKVLF